MPDYRYNLIRYIPDPDRMEPINIGLILQGQGKIYVRFSPHVAKRNDVNTASFREWKDFLLNEVNGEAVPLFQPPKHSAEFLEYLESLCRGQVRLSKSLELFAPIKRSFDEILEALYLRLVLPPGEPERPEETRPTGAFRQFAKEKRFLDRGMRPHAHVLVEQDRLWIAYRQVLNGEMIAMDKVEVAKQLGQTANEIERLPLIVSKLDRFLRAKVSGKATRYILLADQLEAPFTGQGQREFDLLRKDLDERIAAIKNAGGEIMRSPEEAQNLAAQLDRNLPQPD